MKVETLTVKKLREALSKYEDDSEIKFELSHSHLFVNIKKNEHTSCSFINILLSDPLVREIYLVPA